MRLPPSVDPREAALFGMASVAMRTVSNSDPRPNQQVLVVGAGVVGQVATQLAALRGTHVTLCDLDEQRLQIAREIGALDTTVNGENWDDVIGAGPFHHVIDLAGALSMEDKLVEAVSTHGVLNLVAGRFRVDYSFPFGQGRQITIKQNSHFTRDDLHALCRLATKNLVHLKTLLRDVVALDDAARIYDTLRDRPQQLLGTVFDWGD